MRSQVMHMVEGVLVDPRGLVRAVELGHLLEFLQAPVPASQLVDVAGLLLTLRTCHSPLTLVA